MIFFLNIPARGSSKPEQFYCVFPLSPSGVDSSPITLSRATVENWDDVSSRKACFYTLRLRVITAIDSLVCEVTSVCLKWRLPPKIALGINDLTLLYLLRVAKSL